MKVKEIMTPNAQAIWLTESLFDAAQLMWENDCGALPIIKDGRKVIGMITDRDICMSALFKGKPLYDLRVSDAMSRQLQTCRPGDSLADAERTMSQARIRRLPVVDEKGSLVGMISLADLAREAAREITASKHEITETEVGDTLAAICQPSAQQLAA